MTSGCWKIWYMLCHSIWIFWSHLRDIPLNVKFFINPPIISQHQWCAVYCVKKTRTLPLPSAYIRKWGRSQTQNWLQQEQNISDPIHTKKHRGSSKGWETPLSGGGEECFPQSEIDGPWKKMLLGRAGVGPCTRERGELWNISEAGKPGVNSINRD